MIKTWEKDDVYDYLKATIDDYIETNCKEILYLKVKSPFSHAYVFKK